MKHIVLLLLGSCLCSAAFTQKSKDTASAKMLLDSINRLLDRAVVKKELSTLQTYYADDFYFLHATGKIDNKASWMKSVSNPNSQTLSREHDSVVVELHDDVALLTGILSVRFPPNTRAGYAIRYIRVYALRKEGWRLLSHHSTAQWTITN
ncbi:MAG: nuclear transport factor 2 family protein [Chitinophagaceae bacterium]|nr:MAG: nuclear transport factor 2 family protein [Chitinophagaceae bacterium]